MIDQSQKIVQWLFETKALTVCPEDKPFWYASCEIGPVYFNTHYLYENKSEAEELLKYIDKMLGSKNECSKAICDRTKSKYDEIGIYKELIDTMYTYIKDVIGIDNIDYVSGGERRDWFFSLILAEMIDKKHVTLFKTGETFIFENGTSEPIENVKPKSRFLHIADLITTASSYTKAWVPMVEKLGGIITDSLVVVDRLQGGGENIAKLGIKSHALIGIDQTVFETAHNIEFINDFQYQMITNYFKDPKKSMRDFLLQHKEFLANALNSTDTKEAGRACECIEKNIYDL